MSGHPDNACPLCESPTEVDEVLGPFGFQKTVTLCTSCWWDSLHLDPDLSFLDTVRLFFAGLRPRRAAAPSA